MDIYMAGSTFKELNSWLQEKGYNKLFSQENDRREIKNWVDYRRSTGDMRSKLFIDSGAFSAHTKGIDIDVDEYIQYLNDNEDAFTVYVQVDKIPGEFRKPKTREQKLEAPKLSWDNYLYMAPKLKNKDKLLPVFHQGEEFKWLRNMLEYTDENGKHIPYIGISPANDVSTKDRDMWLNEVYHIIETSSNPNVKTHGLGVTSLKLLEKYPFTSADSTGWIMTAVNGMIFSPQGSILVSEVTKSNLNNFENLKEHEKQTILDLIKSKGFTFEQLSTDYKQRELWNIMYMNDWADNYVYKGGKRKRNKLFELDNLM